MISRWSRLFALICLAVASATAEADDVVSRPVGRVAASTAPKRVQATSPIRRVGVVNWDCSVPSMTFFGHYQTQSLGPAKFRDRTPYYARVTGPDSIEYPVRDLAAYEIEMRYAIEAGIDYFAYCWYDCTPEEGKHLVKSALATADGHTSELTRARRLHLQSALRDKLGLCAILVCCQPYSDTELLALARAMKEPCYEKIGNRPLLYVFEKPWRETLTRLFRHCREAGVLRPYVVLMVNGDIPKGDYEIIDAFGAYATCAQGRSYGDLFRRGQALNEARAKHGKPTVPMFSLGWDPSPRIERPVPWCRYAPGTYPPPATEAELLSAGTCFRAWADANRSVFPSGHVLSFAWNEFEEGGWLCPTWTKDGPDTSRVKTFRKIVSSLKAGDHPCIDGIYPHLAMFNDEGECGTGAVVPWAGSLWAVTYGPHCPVGSSDRLYQITPDLTQIVRAESIGGTPANRLMHRETNQLLIGPYVIDSDGNVRTVPVARMPGRLTGAARHLTDPAGKVYVATMETGLYELDMRTLDVKTLIRENGKNDAVIGDYLRSLGAEWPSGWAESSRTQVPGYHAKGLASGFGRVFVANNGEDSEEARRSPFVASGVLARWRHQEGDWEPIRRCQFTDIATRDGIWGNEHPQENPIWTLGWDAKSVILAVTTNGERWATYRLPKASHAYDGAHGWNTEWPRIRDVGEPWLLATMHGTFWRFPRDFSPARPNGIRPLSTYLKVIGDFCRWGDRIVFGCDDHAKNAFLGKRSLKGDSPRIARSQSNLWFVKPSDLTSFGPPSGEGWVWLHEDVKAGELSDPFLFAGYEDMSFSFDDADGRPVPHELVREGDWARVRALKSATGACAHFVFGPRRPEKLPSYGGFVEVKADDGRTYRFPNVNGDTHVICREVATERDLLYAGGVFYEIPADNAGGFDSLRPIALADEPVTSIDARLGLLYVNGKPMSLDRLWQNDTASAAYWLWRDLKGRSPSFRVDARVPAGNAIVEKVEDDVVFLRPDLRDTRCDWFYWKFRVCGAEGRKLTFRFTRGRNVGTRGAAVSFDRGRTWAWTDDLQPAEKEAQTGDHADLNSFSWDFAGTSAPEVWFCQAIPYDASDWASFLAQHEQDRGKVFETSVLCKSRKGRDVEFARFGRLDGKAPYRIFITSRHHCGEMSATYSVEGTLASVFGDDELGRWQRENVEYRVVPFVDKDGVVDGDQGKLRLPHDHERDYNGECLYPETKAVQESLMSWRPDLFLDYHSPWLRGNWFKKDLSNEFFYLVGVDHEANTAAQRRFAKILESTQTGGLDLRASDFFWHGRGWNSKGECPEGLKSVTWALKCLPELKMASTFEIPFANARFKTLRPQELRAFGRDVARACRVFLSDMSDDEILSQRENRNRRKHE